MEHYPSPHKKEIKKAWLFTIILHLVIAGILITYWYFNQSKKTDLIATNLQTQSQSVAQAKLLPLPPLKTELASAPIPSPNTTENITSSEQTNTTIANNAQTNEIPPTVTPSTAPTKKIDNQPIKETPLSKYISNQMPNTQTNTNIDKPSNPTNKPAQDIKPVLTQRDLPRNEMPKNQNNKQKPAQQEITKLTQEAEQENDKISKLIEQVKAQNQRKIDENLAKNRSTITEKPQTKKVQTDTEKSDIPLPTPIPVETTPKSNANE